jgi:DNA-binding CsgD family transcriptional regulator
VPLTPGRWSDRQPPPTPGSPRRWRTTRRRTGRSSGHGPSWRTALLCAGRAGGPRPGPHLRAALDRFDALGAAAWAGRAQAELRACGQAVNRRVAGGTVDRLTPQEVQVAQFVARGLSNADVAAQLFLSRRTIDFHLRNVFAKLGITSRTELAHLVAAQVVPGAERTG